MSRRRACRDPCGTEARSRLERGTRIFSLIGLLLRRLGQTLPNAPQASAQNLNGLPKGWSEKSQKKRHHFRYCLVGMLPSAGLHLQFLKSRAERYLNERTTQYRPLGALVPRALVENCGHSCANKTAAQSRGSCEHTALPQTLPQRCFSLNL